MTNRQVYEIAQTENESSEISQAICNTVHVLRLQYDRIESTVLVGLVEATRGQKQTSQTK